eukprot:snap_masked-scaffold_44-processed-gene-1.57-mRNA-1 protein AED:1.00 eAED:1.00 QI:0/0/0/0/1/1/2/0/386
MKENRFYIEGKHAWMISEAEYTLNLMGGNELLNKAVSEQFGGVSLSFHEKNNELLEKENIMEDLPGLQSLPRIKNFSFKHYISIACHLVYFPFLSKLLLNFLKQFGENVKVSLSFDSCVFESQLEFEILLSNIFFLFPKSSDLNITFYGNQLIKCGTKYLNAPVLNILIKLEKEKKRKLANNIIFYFTNIDKIFSRSPKSKKLNKPLLLCTRSKEDVVLNQKLTWKLSNDSLAFSKSLSPTLYIFSYLSLQFHLFTDSSIRLVTSILYKIFNSTTLRIPNLSIQLAGKADPIAKLFIDLLSKDNGIGNNLNIAQNICQKPLVAILLPFAMISSKIRIFQTIVVNPSNLKTLKKRCKGVWRRRRYLNQVSMILISRTVHTKCRKPTI